MGEDRLARSLSLYDFSSSSYLARLTLYQFLYFYFSSSASSFHSPEAQDDTSEGVSSGLASIISNLESRRKSMKALSGGLGFPSCSHLATFFFFSIFLSLDAGSSPQASTFIFLALYLVCFTSSTFSSDSSTSASTNLASSLRSSHFFLASLYLAGTFLRPG